MKPKNTPKSQAQRDKELIAKLRKEATEFKAKLKAVENSICIDGTGKTVVKGNYLHEASKTLGAIRDGYLASTTKRDAQDAKRIGSKLWDQLVLARLKADSGQLNDSNNLIGLNTWEVKDLKGAVAMKAVLWPKLAL